MLESGRNLKRIWQNVAMWVVRIMEGVYVVVVMIKTKKRTYSINAVVNDQS